MLSMQKNAAVIVALNFFFAFFIVSDAVDCFLSPVLRKLLQAVFNGGEAALRGCFVNPDNKIRQFDINNQPQSGRAQHDNQVKYVAENEKCVAYVVIVKDADEVSKYACKIKTADNDNFRRIFRVCYHNRQSREQTNQQNDDNRQRSQDQNEQPEQNEQFFPEGKLFFFGVF